MKTKDSIDSFLQVIYYSDRYKTPNAPSATTVGRSELWIHVDQIKNSAPAVVCFQVRIQN